MKLILVGTLAGGFAAAAVMRAAEEAKAFVAAKLANGELAEALDIEDPATRDKRVRRDDDGSYVIVFGEGLQGGFAAFGPFADQDIAEEFGEAHRPEDEEWQCFEVETAASVAEKVVGGNPAAAATFFRELLDSTETLTGIAEEHGARTLADLMYLQNAIANGGFIDHYPGESKVLDIVRGLPSGETWAKFITVEYLAGSALGVTLNDLLATDKAADLDRLLKQAATECGYHSTLDVNWGYWHYGRHAEHAEQNHRPEMARLFSAAWQIEHRVHGQAAQEAADVAREEISTEFAVT